MRPFRAILLTTLLVGAPFVATAQPPALPADGTLIVEVIVEGTERTAPDGVRDAMEMREGTEFTRRAYQGDLQAISNLGYFDPMETRIRWEETDDGRGVRLVVAVKENPSVARITIVGNVRFNEKQLLAELGYKPGDMLPTGARASTIRNLRSFYQGGGYKSANINVQLRETADGTEVLITIDEGERVRIKAVRFHGNTEFNAFLLRNQLINSPGLLFFDNYFDDKALDEDAAVIRNKYQERGYLDATVELGELDYNQEKRTVVVNYLINEGQRYRVSKARVEGVTYFTQDEVARALEILPDRRFRTSRLFQAIAEVRKLYGDQGYVDTAIDYELEKDSAAGTVDVVLKVRESGVSYVGEVTLLKEDYEFQTDINAFEKLMDWFAPPLNDEAVYKELRLVPGEKFRQWQEERTRQRLRKLGVFRRVDVQRIPTGDPQVKDVVLALEEDPAAAFLGVTAGVGQYSGAAITFEIVQPNFTGNADRIRAAATFGENSTYFRLGYFDRYIGDSDTSANYSLYRMVDRFRAYRQRIYGGEVEFGHPYGEYLTGYLALRAEKVDFSDYRSTVRTDMDGYHVLAARPMLEYDRRDDTTFPTRGYMVGGGFETGYADGYMLKFLHSYESYKKLNRDNLVYAYEHSVGAMPMDADEIGLSERFFLGGSRTLRGFRYKEVGPRDEGDDRLAIGGATRVTQRHELRYPFSKEFRGRIFADIGLLDEQAFNFGKPRVGVGPGLSFDLGPFTVDIDVGFAVVKESTDRHQYLHIRLGSRF